MKIIDSVWFSGGHGCVGIVKVQYKYDGIAFKIGVATGHDREQDEKRIAEWGSSFPYPVGNMLIGERFPQ
jgi:hypothetical protein